MSTKEIRNELLRESYYEIDHKSGLKILVMEKPDYSGAFAIFGTNYGSVDTCFRLKGEDSYTSVPEGIAHFLEHKLFESEELDAFARFNKTGAKANAFTSFDRTCYLFHCSDSFDENLEILLDFVKSPYFTEDTVQKEQGIIGQEIKMYQDDPDWQVLFNLLRAVYHKNPVRIDIAGTVESIADITADLLYSCYNTFYNLSNMALAVAGNVTKEQVIAITDKILKKEEPAEFEQIIPDEEDSIVTDYIEEALGTDIPKFAIGFKHRCDGRKSIREVTLMNILLDIIAGNVSSLYSEMMEEGIINTSFDKEYFEGRGFALSLFIGEGTCPEKVRDKILDRIAVLKTEGISDEDFDISLKRLYGMDVRSFNGVNDLANNLISSHFGGYGLFDSIECYKNLTKTEAEEMLKNEFKAELCCLSVVK